MNLPKDELKKLKQPDAFQVEMFHLGNWFLRHRKNILLGLLPFVAIGFMIWGWIAFKEMQAENRRIEVAKIDKVYEEENKKAGEAAQKLQEKLATISKKEAELKTKTDPKAETPSSPELVALEAEKQGIEKEMQKIKADHTASLGQFKKYFEANTKNAEGWRAGMMASNILIEKKQYDEAEKILAAIMASSQAVPFYQTHARLVYISLLEELAKFDDAIKQADLLLGLVKEDKDLEAKALLAKGRVLLLKNQKDEAFKTFDTLITKHENSAEARKAVAIKSL